VTNPPASTTPPAIVDPTTPRTAPATVTSAPINTPAVNPVPSNTIAGGTPETLQLLAEAAQAQAAGRLVDARTKFNKALFDASLSPSERGMIRAQITMLNQTLVFSSTVAPGDALFDSYIVKGGDNPTLIVRRQGLPVDRLFIQRINGLGDGKGLRVGQRVKVTRTPFHAVVSKSAHRLDLYMGTPITSGASDGRVVGPDMQEADWTYIRSFRVGLGESNGTPEGLFIIKANSKLINPTWKNPRTGEFFAADDPKNPIGEHWMGLEGVDENTRKFTGYGIHGTVDPASIGQNMSMGCVRLAADDVAMLYEVLMDKITTVKIVP
jgi:lipoprotein-anchoring transpeptidase ErfK/SrfK